MRELYVVYQSIKAAEDMFTAMEIIPGRVRFRQVEFIDNGATAVNLDMALILVALKNGPLQ